MLIVLALSAILISIVWSSFLTWEKEFASKKTVRSSSSNPSHGALPNLRSHDDTRYRVVQNSNRHQENFGDVKDYALDNSGSDDDDTESMGLGLGKRRLGARTATMTPVNYGSALVDHSYRMSIATFKTNVENIDGEFDMDHHFITFGQYLFSQFLIGPSALWLWLTGSVTLMIRDKLCRMGWIEPKVVDYPTLVGKLCLESALAIHYHGKKKDAGGNEIAGFFVTDFPGVLQDGSFKVFDLLSVDIDLKTKRMVGARLDDEELEADEAAILLFYYTISAMHVKLHAVSNWAINMEPDQMKMNPFVGRNSVITTIYNYFGFSTFPSFYPAFKAMGLMEKDWNSQSLIDTWVHGMQDNIVSHSAISELAPYSEFIDFTCKLRPFFMKEFSKVKKHYFPGCHGEAMYIGTIMHSLDHCRMDWNVEDPLWLNVDHPKYGKMAQLGRIVKVGFVSDIPGLLVHRRYKGSGHPFYDKIYAKAATINLQLADCMDTCIVK